MKRTTNNSYTELLIVYLIARIKLNFKDQKYEGNCWKSLEKFIPFYRCGTRWYTIGRSRRKFT